MANSKLIVVEGAQGAGKTTITDFLRYSLSYTNLYRLCGTSDSTKTGLKKATDMYENLLDYIHKMENLSINLVFDRTFFTEENYCRLGKKEYSFTEEYNKLLERFAKLDFDIYYITLYNGCFMVLLFYHEGADCSGNSCILSCNCSSLYHSRLCKNASRRSYGKKA